MADAIAKCWVMPRTGTALSPVDSTSAGVIATKGFNLAADLIGGLPELEDQIGGAMVGTSGQARAERVSTGRARSGIVRCLSQRQPRPPCRLASHGRGRHGVLTQHHRPTEALEDVQVERDRVRDGRWQSDTGA